MERLEPPCFLLPLLFCWDDPFDAIFGGRDSIDQAQNVICDTRIKKLCSAP